MDPVTHLTSGMLASQSFRKFLPDSRLFPLLCLTAAVLPDIDNFVGAADPAFYLLHHRGITHSLLGGLALAVVLALAFRILSRRVHFLKAALVAYFLILTHIFLDLITSFGTQVFAPFSDRRLTLDACFIIDPIFTLTLIAVAVAAWRLKPARALIGTLGLVWIFAYPAVCIQIRDAVRADCAAALAERGATYDALRVTTDALSPIYWKVIVDRGETRTLTMVSSLSPGRKFETVSARRADHDLLRALGEQDRLFSVWDWFSVYPVQEETELPSGDRRIRFADLRFMSVSPLMRLVLGNDEPPFTLTATVSSTGRLESYVYTAGRRVSVQTRME